MEMNVTQFLEHGGSACARTDTLSDVIRYSPDPTKPGCSAAYESYRAATTPSFTCDCFGDHAFLGGSGGVRSGTVFTISNIVGIALTALLGPPVGTWIDHNGGKKLWTTLVWTAGLCMIGMVALGPNFVWLIGLIIQIFTILASELVTIPRQTYLTDLRDPNPPAGATEKELAEVHAAFQTRVSGNRIILSYISQIIVVAIAAVLTGVVSVTLASQILTVLAGIWYLSHYLYLITKFPVRTATREAAGRSLCSVAYGQLWTDLKVIAVSHPEALKYLLFLFIVQNGTASTALSVAFSFMIEQLALDDSQTSITFGITLIFGPLWIKAMHLILKKCKFSYRNLLLTIVLIWIAAVAMIGLVVNNMGMIDGRYNASFLVFLATLALLGAPGLTWYYTLYWPAFAYLVPEAQVNQFGGIFTTVRTLGLIPQPIIYVACSNAFNSASEGRQVGLLLMIVWNIIAIPVLFWIDFEKGRAEAMASKEEAGIKFHEGANKA